MENDTLELQSSDFEEDRYARLRLIPWWDQERLKNATIMVVGAGAIGNELIKNLTLLGIGRILVYDMDAIESTNLTRSVLYRARDVGRYKAEVAAERAKEMNPDVKAKAFIANIIDDVGLGVFRRMNVVLGGLDNREARLSINQSCYKVERPWIDGAIEALNGFARVFIPGQGACYECTMTETDWMLINKRKSCALLTHEQMAEGKIPTTPTSSSIIAGIQVQEMLKLLHADRNLPTLAGKGYVFNGLTHDSYVVEYQCKEDCMSHDTYEKIVEKPWSVKTIALKDVLEAIRSELGERAVLDFDRDIATRAKCTCGECKDLFTPVHKLKGHTVDTGKDEPAEEKTAEPLFSIKNILIVILSVAVVFLIFSNISTNKRLEKIEKEQEKLETQQLTLTNSANQALFQMQQLISAQDTEIEELKKILKDAGIIVEPETPVVPEDNTSTNTGTGDTEQGTTDTTTDTTTEETTKETTVGETTETTEGGTTANE